ncbi:hypothetical protein SporoP37_09080 [Sporosarcina sp. P37]|uniref:hypothetical protein n=1 Tax=unclassified Sporosarcina TaxID=2647733 RepID=UPI000A17A538|nr:MULTISPECIES: hypothetical protein [unclassified Sporosarcina]ARK24802.1 hypothetical protein SporoP37_09080 [Sporosarcina sp. P37]PID19960.1 hypothetical protein CSV62_01615 [Sporosarcina sp. P35]
MFSTQWSVNELAKRQYVFKLSANGAVFTTLIVLQIIGTVFISGASSTSMSDWGEPISFNFTSISNDGQVGLTLFWALIVGFLLTSAAQRNESFSFVTNRLTFQLANFYFICTAALFGGVTTVLLGSVMKIVALFGDNVIIETAGLLSSPLDYFSRILVMTAYTLLLLMTGYLLGTLIQFSKLFIALFGLVWFVYITFGFRVSVGEGDSLLYFYYGETSILLFILKVAVSVAVLFGISFFVTNRLEVRNP